MTKLRKPGTFNLSKKQTSKQTHYPVHEPLPLLDFLRQQIDHKSRNFIKAMLSRGQVSLAGQVVTVHDYTLQVGDVVKVSWEKEEESAPLLGVRIDFEDEHLLVVEKDSGLLTIATDQEKTRTVYHQLMNYVKQKNPKNRVFIVHRLDRDTSGMLLFAKSEKVKIALQETWHSNVRERKYIAVVEGNVKQAEGKIVSWLKESKTLKMYSSPYPNGGQEAITEYRVRQTGNSYSLLEVQLHTGRKNQIRVHLQDLGHPIVGDDKYGAKKNPLKRLALHAQTIDFLHPVTGQEMHFEAKIPATFLSLFRTQ